MPRISDLPAAGTITGPELLPIVQGGITKRVIFDEFMDAVAEEALAVVEPLIEEAETAASTASQASENSSSAATISAAAAERAEAALASIEAATARDPATYIAPLLTEHTNGIMVDATDTQTNYAVQIRDTVTPGNVYLGPLYGFMPSTAFLGVKMIQRADGTFQWVDHNDVLQSDTFSSGSWTKTNLTATGGAADPLGGTTAFTLAVTGAANVMSQNVTVLANMYRTWGFVVKAGTTTWVAIETTDTAVTKRTWFNPNTGATGTVDAGVTFASSTNFPDGTPMPAGFYWIAQTRRTVGTSVATKIILADADGGTTATVGRTVIACRAEGVRGAKRLANYLATTTATVKGIPYDWTNGEQQLVLDVSTAYRGRWGDDMTNAAWTKTNVTAAQDRVGPHGEACSSLTATSNNGTCIQSVTSAGTTQHFHGWVRRVSGSGTLEMTVNNGSNWTAVTPGTAGGTWTAVSLRGVLANPTVGFRLGTSGDVFEFALVNTAPVYHLPAPAPIYAIDYTSITDAFTIPFTEFNTSGSYLTMYADVILPTSAIGSNGIRNKVGFTSGGTATATADLNTVSTGPIVRAEHQTNDGTSRIYNFGNLDAGGRWQVQLRLGANDHAVCYNGNPVFWNANAGSITNTQIAIVVASRIFLRRLLVVNENIESDNDTLRTWHLDTTASNINTGLLASAFVYKYASLPSTGIARIPSVEVLSERGDIAEILCVYGLRHDTGYSAEHPQKIMQRKFQFDRSTNTLTALTDNIELFKPSGWDSGLAPGTQGYTLHKIKYGKWRGRLVLVYVQQDGDTDGNPDGRNLYIKYSDDNATSWSTGVKILDKSVFLGGSAGFVCTGENSTTYQVPASGTNAYRLYMTLNVNNNTAGVMWTDDFMDAGNGTGNTWHYTGEAGIGGTRVPLTGYGFGTLSEPAIAPWPDGSLILVFRNSAGGAAAWARSTDAGLTWTTPIVMVGDNASNTVNCGFLQDDPTGGEGLRGRLILARSTASSDLAHKVQSSFDDVLTLGNNYLMFPRERNVGYCPIKKLYDSGDWFVCMPEVQPTAAANTSTSQFLTVFRY